MAGLKQWCARATEAAREQDGTVYGFVSVAQEGFEKHPPKTFACLVQAFSEYLY
jgi:type III restriction enzyme